MPSSERSGIVRHGVHAPLEAAADELIFGHLAKVTRSADKADVLTPWKERDRRKREIYVPTGVPDAALRSGIFNRAENPDPRYRHLNSMEAAIPVKQQEHGASRYGWDNE